MDDDLFEQLIGDVELLKPVLRGFFEGWPGIYDFVLFKDDKKDVEYLINAREGFQPFCKLYRVIIRGTDRGCRIKETSPPN